MGHCWVEEEEPVGSASLSLVAQRIPTLIQDIIVNVVSKTYLLEFLSFSTNTKWHLSIWFVPIINALCIVIQCRMNTTLTALCAYVFSEPIQSVIVGASL